MLNIDEMFSLLTDSVPIDSPLDLINKCEEIGMNQISYTNSGFDSTLPEFDKGYNFIYNTNDGVEARLEILEKDSIIMQAGIQIIYPPSFFFSKAKKHINILRRKSDDYYGECLPMEMSGSEILNYGNSSSVCYLSKMKVKGSDVINFRVGNRKFW